MTSKGDAAGGDFSIFGSEQVGADGDFSGKAFGRLEAVISGEVVASRRDITTIVGLSTSGVGANGMRRRGGVDT